MDERVVSIEPINKEFLVIERRNDKVAFKSVEKDLKTCLQTVVNRIYSSSQENVPVVSLGKK